MPVETVQCPSCGAPVRLAEHASATACVYCNMPLSVTRDGEGHKRLTEDTELDKAEIAEIKQLLLAGNKSAAVARYRQAKTDATEPEALAAVEGYTTNIVQDSIKRSTMSALGWVWFVFSIGLVLGGAAIVATMPSLFTLGVGMLVPGALLLLMVFPLAIRSIRYLGASIGEATILHHAHLGSGGSFETYRLHLRVAERTGASFEVELPMPVSPQRRHRVREGHRMLVKYFPGQLESVVYYGDVDS